MDDCTFLLTGMQVVMELAWSLFGGDSPALLNSISRDIPSKLPAIIEQLDIKPKSRGYVCCLKCFACYDIDDFPDRCTQKQNAHASHRVCGAPLRRKVRRKGQVRDEVIRKYLHHDLKDWIARLLSRPGLERYLDRDVFGDTPDPSLNCFDEEQMRDIWDGSVLREFRGPDGRLFVKEKSRISDGRYIFSLCMDEFNPYHNKQAGKTASVGAIYMVCLNLPPHLRFRVENVFLVGVIPGPKKPSIEQINEILRPLVDDLLIFWNPGVYFSRTFRYARGRLVNCVIIPLVCDLPAVRQMAGFAAHSSTHFCSFCLLRLDQADNLDLDQWNTAARTYQRHLKIAEKWRDASRSGRKTLFEKYGIRWTELLRLPYWDPTRFVVVDSMHALLLNCIKRHLRTLWGMDASLKEGTDPTKKAERVPSEEQLVKGWRLMRHGSDAQLEKLPAYVLKQICLEAQVVVDGKKSKILQALYEHVSNFCQLLICYGFLNLE